MVNSVYTNLMILQEYRNFPFEIYERIHVIDKYMSEKLPAFAAANPDAVCIASLAGETLDEFLYLAEKLTKIKTVKAFELNISCPNVAKGGMHFGADCNASRQLVTEMKKISSVPVWVKVTPSTTDPVGQYLRWPVWPCHVPRITPYSIYDPPGSARTVPYRLRRCGLRRKGSPVHPCGMQCR